MTHRSLNVIISPMTGREVREKYLKFFEEKGHARIQPARLVLDNDQTTLFTSSGMQPLIPYLLGESSKWGQINGLPTMF